MARRRNSVALFEVIHSDKRFGKQAPAAQPLRTPLWWFKNKTKDKPAEAEAEAVEVKAKVPKAAKIPSASAPAAAPAPAAKEKIPEKKLSPMAYLKAKMTPPPLAAEPDNFEPEAVFAPDHSEFKHFEAARDAEQSPPSRATPVMKAVDLAVDPDQQTISFRLTYTTALVGGFALLIIVILAFVIGQHLTRKPTPALTSMSTEELRALPAHGDVINVDSSKPTTDPKPPPTPAVASPIKTSGTKVAPPDEGPQPPKSYTTIGERQNGLTYVIVQSYPDEHDAVKAKDILNQEGILCTVEPGIEGWGKWYVVVGVQGFARYRSDEFKAYVASIEAVSKKFAKNSKFKQFEPQPYTWRQSKK